MSSPADRRAMVVGLTGGIASGKSTVSGLFAELGVPVIDSDVIARELVEPGQPLLSSIVAAFGKELLNAVGRLRRRRLRNLIFAHPDKRARLESLMHPRIAEEANRRIREVTAPYCIQVIPLLAEAGGRERVDRVLVVDAEPESQARRLMKRDGVSRKQVEASLQAQASREARLAIADDVIDNSGDREDLAARVEALHRLYLSLAAARDGG